MTPLISGGQLLLTIGVNITAKKKYSFQKLPTESHLPQVQECRLQSDYQNQHVAIKIFHLPQKN